MDDVRSYTPSAQGEINRLANELAEAQQEIEVLKELLQHVKNTFGRPVDLISYARFATELFKRIDSALES